MYILQSTFTLLVLIAHARCATLRQYGPDWLIPKPDPDPQVDSKRITAKSVFIAPSLHSHNVRCATGFKEDASGRCVKLVHVNQAAQLDFLLQRLNAMYGDAPPAANHSEQHPLQVAVGIPVEVGDGNDAGTPLKGEEMYSEAVLPEGQVSLDLLAGTLSQPGATEQTATDKNSTNGNQDEDLDGNNEESVLPDFGNESEDNQTILMIQPNKEWFQVDEEPLVSLTSTDTDDEDEEEEEAVGNTTASYENGTNTDVELPDTSVSVHSVDDGSMANITKNASNIVKKETLLADSSVSLISQSTSNHAFTETYPLETANATGVQSVHVVTNTTEQVAHSSNHSTDISPSSHTASDEKNESTEDESINEVHIKSTDIVNTTSSKPNDTTTSTSVSPTTEASAPQTPTSQQLVTSFTSRETTTREPTSQVTSTTPTLATQVSEVEPTTEQSTNKVHHSEDEKQGGNEDDYEDPIREADVEPEMPDEYYTDVSLDPNQGGDHPPEGSADVGLVPSVSESTVDADDERFGVETHLEGSDVGVDKPASLNSTEPIEKTQLDNNGIINVPSSNGTSFDEYASVNNQTIETGVNTSSQVLSNVTAVKEDMSEVLKADSTVQNVEMQPYELSEIVHSVSQQMQHQPVVTPQHSVHVVYPQPIIQVLNVKKEPPHSYPINAANQNEPFIGHKENLNPNSPQVQLHNLNPIPNPVQSHNFNPLPQMPLVEKAPGVPPNYDVHPYRPLPPHAEIPRPYLHPHHRPHPQHNPHRTHQNAYPNGQGGFVRFPSGLAHDEANTVRFPQEDARNNDKYSRWGNWRVEERRPEHSYWTGAQDSQYPQGTNQRNYWVDNRPNRRRPQPGFYY